MADSVAAHALGFWTKPPANLNQRRAYLDAVGLAGRKSQHEEDHAYRRNDGLRHREIVLEEPHPAAINQLYVDPVNQQGSDAELPHPTPAIAGDVASPNESES